MKIRKQFASPSSDELGVILKSEEKNKTVCSNIKRIIQSLSDYSGDALAKTNKYISSQSGHTAEELAKDGSLAKYVKNFNLHRAGTRVLSNFGMWGAVVAFYTLIPKLYNMGLKHDPGLKGLESEDKADNTVPKTKVKDENKKVRMLHSKETLHPVLDQTQLKTAF